MDKNVWKPTQTKSYFFHTYLFAHSIGHFVSWGQKINKKYTLSRVFQSPKFATQQDTFTFVSLLGIYGRGPVKVAHRCEQVCWTALSVPSQGTIHLFLSRPAVARRYSLIVILEGYLSSKRGIRNAPLLDWLCRSFSLSNVHHARCNIPKSYSFMQ